MAAYDSARHEVVVVGGQGASSDLFYNTTWALAGACPCRADFDCSGAVSLQDIFDFLSRFFEPSPLADFNGVGGVTVQDVFDFLGAYFAGC
jgi:hypothetical protein